MISIKFSFLLISLLCASEAFQGETLPKACFVRTASIRFPLVALSAKKKKASPALSKALQQPGTGFGGVALEPCSCGSNIAYSKCCGKIHRDSAAYAAASPDQVVRARYTAYAKRVVDFIIASTHPDHPSFQEDIRHWRETISKGYDAFELCKCEILETTTDEGDQAQVRFLAHMTERNSGTKQAFIETSTFERDPTNKAWLYRDGVVQAVDEP